MAYYLGLDNGGTVTKAAIFDSTGRSLALARVETEVQITGPGFAERDMEQMWHANCTVIRSALEQAKLSPEEIACVTCSRKVWRIIFAILPSSCSAMPYRSALSYLIAVNIKFTILP